jgi:hypothetical protein
MPVIPALWRLGKEYGKFKGQPELHSDFKTRLGYIAKRCVKKKKISLAFGRIKIVLVEWDSFIHKNVFDAYCISGAI